MLMNRPVSEHDSARAIALTQRLLAEWKSPHDEGEPVIVQENSGSSRIPRHIYVVWSAWWNMSPLERSRIIMQAYREFLGEDDAPLSAEVTVAMGLTPDEAKRLRLDY